MNTLGKARVFYDGIKWQLNGPLNKYYRSTNLINGRRLYLHRYIFEKYNILPPKTDIHHKDFNYCNNCIENLQAISRSEHRKLHNKTSDFISKRIITNKNQSFISKVQAKLNLLRRTYADSNAPCINCGRIFKVSLMKRKEQKTCSKHCYFQHYNKYRRT